MPSYPTSTRRFLLRGVRFRFVDSVTLLSILLAVGMAPAFAAPDSAASLPASAADPILLLSTDKSPVAAALPLAGPLSASGFAAPAPAVPATPAFDAAPGDAGAEPGLLGRVRERAANMIITAMNFVGVPYRRGGVSAESGFDCSGFTRRVFDLSLGLVLPRRAEEQAAAPGLVSVARNALQPGDLVFFNTMRRTFSHVGIYIGDNRFIHSPRSGGEVRTENMGLAYWVQRFDGARRASAEQLKTLAVVVVDRATPR